MHYKEVDDLHQIWPPIVLPKGSKGMLPHLKDLEPEEPVIPESRSDIRDPEAEKNQQVVSVTHIDDLIEGYNFALEQFGEDATYNYLKGLAPKDERVMDWMINRNSKEERALNPKNKEPP